MRGLFSKQTHTVGYDSSKIEAFNDDITKWAVQNVQDFSSMFNGAPR